MIAAAIEARAQPQENDVSLHGAWSDGAFDFSVRASAFPACDEVFKRCYAGYLIVAAAAVQITSSCDPVPPEQPMPPTILPSSISGIPPREAITPSSDRI
jgi:hypothetical protein